MKEHIDFSGRPTFTFEELRVSRYSRIVKNLSRRFKLQPEGKFVDTNDLKLQEFSSGSLLVSLEWSTESGFSVNSRNANSDELTREIADYSHKKYRA